MAANSPEVVAERRARVVELHEAGFSSHEISAAVGIAERNVRNHLRAAGIGDQRYAAKRVEMPRRRGNLRPVRLTDVPVRQRLEAARALAAAGDPDGEALLAAALQPSATAYFIPERRLDAGTVAGSG